MNLLISIPMSLMGFVVMAGALAEAPAPKPAVKQEVRRTATPRAVELAAVAAAPSITTE